MTKIILAIIILLFAIAGVVGFIGFLHWGRHREKGLLPYLFYPVIHNVVWQTMVSGRSLYATTNPDMPDPVLVLPPYVLWASRLTSLFILLAVSERIINRIINYTPQPKTPAILLLAFIFFFLTTVVFTVFFSAHPSISHEYFYLFLGGSAALLFSHAEGETAICAARTSIFLCLITSAIYLFVKPELVISNDYTAGLIPGLTLRYAGLTSHANSLGPLTVVFLLCLWHKPYSGWLNRFAWFLGGLTLLLAQSKTSWIIFLICMPFLIYFRYGAALKRQLFDFKKPIFLATLLIIGMLSLTLIVGIIMFGPTGNPLSSFFVSKAGADLMTMTGRNQIWEVAVREWHRSPLFGYGLTIWNEKHRAVIGLEAAVTAHSQFYQTLSSSGIVGVAGLLIYVTTMFCFVIKTTRISQGLTLAFFLTLAIRSISEVPLTMVGYYGPDELSHILVLMIIASNYSALHNKNPAPLSAR